MFKNALNQIVERTEGSVAALIMGLDGIEVEKVFKPEAKEANFDVAIAEFSSLVRTVLRIGDDTGMGQTREFFVAYDNATFIARLFNREYFVVLALNAEGNIGRGRFELHKADLMLANEFAV